MGLNHKEKNIDASLSLWLNELLQPKHPLNP